MRIKENKQLKKGDIISWGIKTYEDPTVFNCLKPAEFKKCNLVCMEVYPHHVLFRMVKPPHSKVDIQNVDLWKNGIYKQDDILKPFARKVD